MSPPSLINDLVEQILLRLPPDDPACLVRASLICKPVRSLLAGAAFRRRYREFHGRPHLLGFFQILHGETYCSRFVPTSVFHPAEPNLPDWLVVDCRHGRALFFTKNREIQGTLDLVVWDPMTTKQRRVPQPSPEPEHYVDCAAAVLCAVEGCDHSGCQEGPFRVAFLSTDQNGVTDARLYSSETGAWSDPTSVHHPRAYVNNNRSPSVLVGEGLYFYSITKHIIEYKLCTPRLSVFEAPALCHGRLVKVEDDKLAFASVEDMILTLWSRETGPKGANGWAKHRVVDLNTLFPDGILSDSQLGDKPSWYPIASVAGFAEGTDVIFVGTFVSVYMVELKSGRVRKVLDDLDDSASVFPYMSFHIPAMEAASTAEGPREGISNV